MDALVVAGGRQVAIVGRVQHRCEGSSGRLQISATITQASTRAFGEGVLDVACPQGAPEPERPLTVTAAPGAPAFRNGTAQASLVYLSQHRQWLGELTLVDRLPSDNPLAVSFRDRLGAPVWLVIVLAVLSGVLLIATAGLLVRGRRRAGGVG
ncbi:MAG: hypothetical protein ACYC91_20315 [Solirubrobacteraceae bacterium]